MENGHDVELGTVEKTDWNKVYRLMGVKLPKVPKERFLLREIKKFGIYQRSLTALHVAKFKKGFDLTINTHGDVMPLPVDITYLHFPVFALLAEEPWKYYVKYLKSAFWRLYFEPYHIMQKYLARWMFSRSLLLTNSKFSKKVIKKYVGCESMVVYPPVEIEDYLQVSKNLDRENAVITISRFTPEKHVHLVPYIAKALPDVKFYVIGSVRGFQSKNYYQKVFKEVKEANLKNVSLIPNAPHEIKLKLLGKCKVFLHLMPFEHFGISVVEGMASGCVPVVHKSGGQWIDIVEEGKYGIGYDKLSPNEMASAIKKALHEWSPEKVNSLTTKANVFSAERFKERIIQVVNAYVS